MSNVEAVATLSDEQKAKLHEVADGLLEIYETLAKMRYLEPVDVHRAPHDMTHLHDTYEELKLDPAIIYLHSILPYIKTDLTRPLSFFKRSVFLDFRKREDVIESHETLDYEDSDGASCKFLRPWQTALSALGDHADCAMMYCAEAHRVYILGPECGVSDDPALKLAKFDDEDGLAGAPGRKAPEVLADIVKYYKTLEVMPGGGHYSDLIWEDEHVKDLYKKNGWPDNFDGEAFEVDLARLKCASKAENIAEEPLREVNNEESIPRYWAQAIEESQRKIAEAETEDDRWIARFELWHAERSSEEFKEAAKEQQNAADAFCLEGVDQKQKDLMLWEFKEVFNGTTQKQETLDRFDHTPYDHLGEQWSEEQLARDFREAQKKLAVYKKALVASFEDVKRLCPGRSFYEATTIRSLGAAEKVEYLRKKLSEGEAKIRELRAWESQVPSEARQAKEAVDRHVALVEKARKSSREELDCCLNSSGENESKH